MSCVTLCVPRSITRNTSPVRRERCHRSDILQMYTVICSLCTSVTCASARRVVVEFLLLCTVAHSSTTRRESSSEYRQWRPVLASVSTRPRWRSVATERAHSHWDHSLALMRRLKGEEMKTKKAFVYALTDVFGEDWHVQIDDTTDGENEKTENDLYLHADRLERPQIRPKHAHVAHKIAHC